MQKVTSLPLPSEEAKKHSETVSAVIKNIIREQGQITFAEFMQQALYAPGLGYYSAGAAKFNQEGDFITAPEISPLFGKCIAKQCEEVFQNISQSAILEIGAGTGRLAYDILAHCFVEHYSILELSAELKARQAHLLQERVTWLSTLPRKSFRGVIIANEVVDAMPVHRCYLNHENVNEYYVTLNKNDQFIWKIDSPSSPLLKEKLLQLQQFLPRETLESGYTTEINLLMTPWLKSMLQCLEQGVILIIDYGFSAQEYYHPERSQGTLMCHYRHHAHSDPFWYPGLQDITAHVDFSALAMAAPEEAFLGYCSQEAFLLSLDILSAATADTVKDNYINAQQLKRLLLTSEMGELFKVMALSKNYTVPLQGFRMQEGNFRL